MSQETHLQAIEKLLEPFLGEDIFLVSVKVKPTNNFKIYLDADGGLGIEKCIRINRALYKQIEEKGWYPNGDFSLEVSSPGVDEPLKLLRQYRKNIGRKVEVITTDDLHREGKLVAVTDDSISIEYSIGKGKKAETKTDTIGFNDIKQTRVLVTF